MRSDGETGLSWMSVRAYDPALGRFLSRDPLGRVPLFFSDQPYVYAGNNPLINVDPSGQFMAPEGMSHADVRAARSDMAKRLRAYWGKTNHLKIWNGCEKYDRVCQGAKAHRDARRADTKLTNLMYYRWGRVSLIGSGATKSHWMK